RMTLVARSTAAGSAQPAPRVPESAGKRGFPITIQDRTTNGSATAVPAAAATSAGRAPRRGPSPATNATAAAATHAAPESFAFAAKPASAPERSGHGPGSPRSPFAAAASARNP